MASAHCQLLLPMKRILLSFFILLSPFLLHRSMGADQTLIIDFEKGTHAVAADGGGPSGDYPPDIGGGHGGGAAAGFGQSLTIERGSRVRQGRGDGQLTGSVQELKELILHFDRVFSRRFEQLSKRLDRLEANQLHLRHAALADWVAFSVDKRVRLFGQTRLSWREAELVCRAHAGSLLRIDSESENQRIVEFLKDSDGIYWIGMQTMLHFNMSAVAGNYSNFGGGGGEGEGKKEQQLAADGEGEGDDDNLLDDLVRRCAAIAAQTQGRWLNRECAEKHGFICQV